MKNHFTTLKIAFLLFFMHIIAGESILAQSLAAFNYQAVLRMASGEVMENENVTVFVELLQGHADGSSVFSESHSSVTNTFGLVNLHIGSQNTERFSAIDWSKGNRFSYPKNKVLFILILKSQSF